MECAGKLIAWYLIPHYLSGRLLLPLDFLFPKHYNIYLGLLEAVVNADLLLNNSDLKNNSHSKYKNWPASLAK